jgi:hypothetical protein
MLQASGPLTCCWLHLVVLLQPHATTIAHKLVLLLLLLLLLRLLPAVSTTPAASPSPSPAPTPSLGVAEAAGPTAAPANTVPYTVEHTFPATYATLAADTAVMASFKLGVRRSIATAANVSLDSVRITSVKAGSVIVTTEVSVPDTWTPTQVQQMSQVLTEKVAEVFTPAFLSGFGISGVPTVRLVTPIPKESNSNSVALGVGIGVGIGGALLIAAVAVVVVRRRRMNVDPVAAAPANA